MESDIQTTFENCNKFITNLQDTLKSIINANAEMKSEIDALKKDLRKVRRYVRKVKPYNF